MTFSRSDFHPKKEHSRNYVTDEGGNMDRKDFQRWCRLFFEDYLKRLAVSFQAHHPHHVFVAAEQVAATVEESGVTETALLQNACWSRVTDEMVRPDFLEMFDAKAVVK